MIFEDLKKLYEKRKHTHGESAYKYISTILKKAKQKHKRDFLNSPRTLAAKKEGKISDHEQSWRAFKGKNFEKLISHIIFDEVKNLGFNIINGNSLEKASNLSEELGLVKRKLLIDYGCFGCHLPDIDIVIYSTDPIKIVAVLSVKVTLRERVAHTGYWKIKLANDKVTKHIKVYFITLDEDSTLKNSRPVKKGRAIVKVDTDGCYVLSESGFDESEVIKGFDRFIKDLRRECQK